MMTYVHTFIHDMKVRTATPLNFKKFLKKTANSMRHTSMFFSLRISMLLRSRHGMIDFFMESNPVEISQVQPTCRPITAGTSLSLVKNHQAELQAQL